MGSLKGPVSLLGAESVVSNRKVWTSSLEILCDPGKFGQFQNHTEAGV